MFIRVRPILKSDRCKSEVVVYPEDAYKKQGQKVEGIRITGEHSQLESFYDKVFQQETSQEELFGHVMSNISDVLQGINSTIFAYGQTGSGKTYTMFGPHWNDNGYA